MPTVYRRDVIDGLPRFPYWAKRFGQLVDKTGTIAIRRKPRLGLRFDADLVFFTDDDDAGADGLTATECARLAMMDAGLGRVRTGWAGATGSRWQLNDGDLPLVLPVVAPFLTRLAGPARLALMLGDRKLLYGPVPRDHAEMHLRLCLMERCQQMNQGAAWWRLFAA